MLTESPVHVVLAQAMVEHGLLDGIAAGLGTARARLEFYIGEGNTVYLLAAAAVVVAMILLRRRR